MPSSSPDLTTIVALAKRVKKARRAEQIAYGNLTKLANSDATDAHERAMIHTSILERDLSSLVIRVLVDKAKK